MSVAMSSSGRHRRRHRDDGPSPSPPPSSLRLASLLLLSSVATASGASADASAARATPVEVVISRFDEELSWVDGLHQQAKITVYDKSDRPTPGSIHLHNVGREGHTYLSHIVSRYDTLADWTVFTQAAQPSFGYKGHRSGGGHLNEGIAFADYLAPRPHSFFIDTAAFDTAAFASSLRLSYTYDDAVLASKNVCPARDEWSEWWDMGWFKDYVHDKVRAQNGTGVLAFYNNLVRPEAPPVEAVQLSFPQGARFAVSASAIRAHPKVYYEALLETVSHSADPWAGYYLEWMWPSIFGRKPCSLPASAASPSTHRKAMENLDVLYRARLAAAAATEAPAARRNLAASPLPSPMPPPPSPKPTCAYQIDFALVLDESGSMKKPRPEGSMEGPDGLKALAKQLVNQYSLGMDAARFSVVSFAETATTRVPWSYNATAINAGIDQMSADGKTSISNGFEGAGQLFADDDRVGATKIVLLISDGEQSDEFAAPGKTPSETAIDAAGLVKGSGVTVFAWGIGKVSLETLKKIASDPSKAILANFMYELMSHLGQLQAGVCNGSPPVYPMPSVLPKPVVG